MDSFCYMKRGKQVTHIVQKPTILENFLEIKTCNISDEVLCPQMAYSVRLNQVSGFVAPSPLFQGTFVLFWLYSHSLFKIQSLSFLYAFPFILLIQNLNYESVKSDVEKCISEDWKVHSYFFYWLISILASLSSNLTFLSSILHFSLHFKHFSYQI